MKEVHMSIIMVIQGANKHLWYTNSNFFGAQNTIAVEKQHYKKKDTYYKTMRFHNHDENRGMLPANVRPVLFKATVQEPCKMESEVVTN